MIQPSTIYIVILPLMVMVYYQSLRLAEILQLNRLHYYVILFSLIHLVSSCLLIVTNWSHYGLWKPAIGLAGMGPTIVALLTLLCLPLLKLPLNWLFSSLPYYDILIDPLLMGISAYLTLILIDKALIPAIYQPSVTNDNLPSETFQSTNLPIEYQVENEDKPQ